MLDEVYLGTIQFVVNLSENDKQLFWPFDEKGENGKYV